MGGARDQLRVIHDGNMRNLIVWSGASATVSTFTYYASCVLTRAMRDPSTPQVFHIFSHRFRSSIRLHLQRTDPNFNTKSSLRWKTISFGHSTVTSSMQFPGFLIGCMDHVLDFKDGLELFEEAWMSRVSFEEQFSVGTRGTGEINSAL